jgi:prepilin-type N-terminal cleavage/methylation domain-containing protein
MIKSADCRGYTLLEILIVIAILGMVLVPVSVFFQEYIRKSSSEDLLINKQLAQNMMETVLKTAFYNDMDTVIVLNNRSYQINVRSSTIDDLIELTVTSQRKGIESKPVVLKHYVYLRENKIS